MKAKIKKTGEMIEVTRNRYGIYVDENCAGYRLNDLDFGNEEDEHWQDVRERVAIAAMQGLLSGSIRSSVTYKKYAEAAIGCANALVEELKKKN